MKKGTKLYSILKSKCPKCHETDLFVHDFPLSLDALSEMPKKCPNCNQSFIIETGFYFGAMFISYSIASVGGLLLFLLYHLGFNLELGVSLFLVIIGHLLFVPKLFRLSRAIWINVFVKYEGNLNQ